MPPTGLKVPRPVAGQSERRRPEVPADTPLFGSKSVPLHRRLIVLWDTSSVVVHETQIVLGIGIPLFGSKGPPLHRRLIVLWDTSSVVVHIPQIELGIGTPLFGKGCPFT